MAPDTSVIERMLLMDRVITGSAIIIIFLIAAIYTVAGVGLPMSAFEMTSIGNLHGLVSGNSADTGISGMKMNGLMMPATWSSSYAVLIFFMWWIMMIAMMLPSAASTVLLYTALTRRGNQVVNAPKLAILFLAGYLAVWGLFSLLATVAQWLLELRGFASPMGMALTSNIMGATILIVVGIYQFTPWKQSCLRHCRSPMHFLTERRRSGTERCFADGD